MFKLLREVHIVQFKSSSSYAFSEGEKDSVAVNHTILPQRQPHIHNMEQGYYLLQENICKAIQSKTNASEADDYYYKQLGQGLVFSNSCGNKRYFCCSRIVSSRFKSGFLGDSRSFAP